MARHTKTLSRSFAGGEMTPEMYSRMDDAVYQAGAATILNCIPQPTGSVARRAGTKLISESRDSSSVVQLLSFVFSQDESAVIEASRGTIDGLDSGYFRFHQNGGTLLYPHPERWRSVLNVQTGNGQTPFLPQLSCSVTVANPMVVTVEGHGLKAGDQVAFVDNGSNRTVPDDGNTSNASRPIPNTFYYVRDITTDTFTLSATPGGTKLSCLQHAGVNPVLQHWTRWFDRTDATNSLLATEHRIRNNARLALTMWPTTSSPTVTFSGNTFTAARVPNGYFPVLTTGIQVLFVAAEFGGTLPSGIEEGRLYWVVSESTAGYGISRSFNGPPITIGSGAAGTIRMCSTPKARDGSDAWQVMRPYYASIAAAESNLVRLALSISDAQKSDGGLSYDGPYYGCGPFRLHHAYEKGDIVVYTDPTSEEQTCYYATRDFFEPAFGGDVGVLTKEMHLQSSPRTPAARTAATEGSYWRELPGTSTGGGIPVSCSEFGGVSPLQLTTIGGAAHGLQTGMAFSIIEGTPPDGLATATRYYARRVDAFTITVATTYSGALVGSGLISISLASPRSGNLVIEPHVDFSTDTGWEDTVRWQGHGLSDGDTVVFSESDFQAHTAQTGITLGSVYFVREAATNGFRISSTAAGPLISLPSGTGRFIRAIANSIYEVPHDYSAAELPELGTTQSGDIMTITSQDHPIAELRRVSSSRWELVEPTLRAASSPPVSVWGTATQGEGIEVNGTILGAPGYLTTAVDHTFEHGVPVYVSGLTGSTTLPADGYYIVGPPSGIGAAGRRRIYLLEVEDNAVVPITVTTTGQTARVRYADDVNGDRTITYKVTAIDDNNEESEASDTVELDNDLTVSGAFNQLNWTASPGAARYRVYKKLNGLFGLIGETDELTFKDDNIGPDLGVSPPINDTALLKQASVTFDSASDTVSWTGHELEAKQPVVFRTSDEMPGVSEGVTYYVLNPGDNDFQLAATPDSDEAVSIAGTDTGRHWASAGNFPSTATHFEGRRVFGGSRSRPQDIWMTASGTESDLSYSIPTVDSDRIYFRIASRDISKIKHLVPLSQLLLLSDSTEYRLTPVNDDVVTPSSVSVRPQSFVGAGTPQPALVNNTVVFAAARGGHMRALSYSRDVLGYLTGDLSIRASHLFDRLTITDIAYQKAPVPIVWCVSSSGKLLGATYIPEENIVAWHQHETGGDDDVFESVTVVPEGDEDAVYVVVRRDVGSRGTIRFVERLANEFAGTDVTDAYFVDCGLTYDGAATTTIGGLDHLEGASVAYLADGVSGTATVSSGAITLATAASTVQVGLAMTARLQTLPLSMMRLDAFGSGRQKNVNRIWVRLFQSSGFDAGPSTSQLVPSREPTEESLALTDGQVEVSIPGDWNDDAQVVVQQTKPLPLTISGLTIEVASGG